MTNTIPAFLARTQLGQLLQRVSQQHDRFVVTRNGEPVAIILGIEDFLATLGPKAKGLQQLRTTQPSPRTIEQLITQIDALRHPHRKI